MVPLRSMSSPVPSRVAHEDISDWKKTHNIHADDCGMKFGSEVANFVVYNWSNIAAQHVEIQQFFEKTRCDPVEEGSFLCDILGDSPETFEPPDDMGSLMDVEETVFARPMGRHAPRGDPTMSDAAWFAEEASRDNVFTQGLIDSQICIHQAAHAFSHVLPAKNILRFRIVQGRAETM